MSKKERQLRVQSWIAVGDFYLLFLCWKTKRKTDILFRFNCIISNFFKNGSRFTVFIYENFVNKTFLVQFPVFWYFQYGGVVFGLDDSIRQPGFTGVKSYQKPRFSVKQRTIVLGSEWDGAGCVRWSALGSGRALSPWKFHNHGGQFPIVRKQEVKTAGASV